jgi:hypothetical protein
MPAPDGVPLERVAGVFECEVLDELLVYRPGTEMVVALNASARAIWEHCQERASVAGIAAALGERLGVPGEALLPDVREAVDRLREFGLLSPPRG